MNKLKKNLITTLAVIVWILIFILGIWIGQLLLESSTEIRTKDLMVSYFTIPVIFIGVGYGCFLIILILFGND